MTEWDEEYYDKPIGTPVPEQKVQEWFVNDVQTAIKTVNDIFNVLISYLKIYNTY